MTLDDEHMTAAQDRLEALERDRARDWAERLHELELRDQAESEEATEALWVGRFRQQAKHWSGRQHWDGT